MSTLSDWAFLNVATEDFTPAQEAKLEDPEPSLEDQINIETEFNGVSELIKANDIQLEDMLRLKETIVRTGGMSKSLAEEAMLICPTFDKDRSLATYTTAPTGQHYRVAVEEISLGIAAAAAAALGAILALLLKAIDVFGNDSTDSGGGGGGGSKSKSDKKGTEKAKETASTRAENIRLIDLTTTRTKLEEAKETFDSVIRSSFKIKLDGKEVTIGNSDKDKLAEYLTKELHAPESTIHLLTDGKKGEIKNVHLFSMYQRFAFTNEIIGVLEALKNFDKDNSEILKKIEIYKTDVLEILGSVTGSNDVSSKINNLTKEGTIIEDKVKESVVSYVLSDSYKHNKEDAKRGTSVGKITLGNYITATVDFLGSMQDKIDTIEDREKELLDSMNELKEFIEGAIKQTEAVEDTTLKLGDYENKNKALRASSDARKLLKNVSNYIAKYLKGVTTTFNAIREWVSDGLDAVKTIKNLVKAMLALLERNKDLNKDVSEYEVSIERLRQCKGMIEVALEGK